MKKTVLFTLVLLVLSAGFSFASSAVIQSPPKDSDIAVNVYETDDQTTLDGITGEGEYKKLDISASSMSCIVGSDADWLRAKNTEFEAYASVCSGYFNFALTVPLEEEYYITDCSPKYMWAQTALLMSFAKSGTTGRNALEIGIRPDGNSYVWRQITEDEPDIGFIAVYNDGVITYEVSVPLSAFGAENDPDFKFCFSVSLGDYFNGERQVYLQFGQGISGFSDASDADAGKDAAIFPTVKIIRKTAETEETEEPAVTGEKEEPAETGLDIKPALLICVSVMAVSLSSAYLIGRKRRNN